MLILALTSQFGHVVIERHADLPAAAVRLALPPHDLGAMRARELAQHLPLFEPNAVLGPAGWAGELLRHEGRS